MPVRKAFISGATAVHAVPVYALLRCWVGSGLCTPGPVFKVLGPPLYDKHKKSLVPTKMHYLGFPGMESWWPAAMQHVPSVAVTSGH